MRAGLTAAVLVGLAIVTPAVAQTADPNIVHPQLSSPNLPQPWVPPVYQSPRGTPEKVQPVKPLRVPRQPAQVPPPIVNPQTGVALPNQRTLSPSGPGGTETYQDRATRCAHQAGSYGAMAGDRTTYMGNCINQ